MAKSVSKTNYAYELMSEMLENSSKEMIANQMDISYSKFIQENKDIKLDIPVTILLGEYDRTGKISKYCNDWHNETNYPLYIIPNASHFSNADNPSMVNEQIDNFVKKLKK